MSPAGRAEALKIPMSARTLQLVTKALQGLQAKS
jgi:hypothetical protein